MLYRKIAFDKLHGLSHPGIRASQKLLTKFFVWPSMNKDIRDWVRYCLACQRSKVHRHQRAPLVSFPHPEQRFDQIHLDLIGPLPEANGMCFAMTIIDRFSRWIEVVPLPNATARTCASALMYHWIARYGCPRSVVTDQGRQFESSLWQHLCRYLGIERHHTTAYHPQCNGLIERIHRQLKAALMSRLRSSSWVDELPLVLLGMRVTAKENGFSSAEMHLGAPLRLPGSFFDTPSEISPEEFVETLRRSLKSIPKYPAQHHSNSSVRPYIDPRMKNSTHVFLRVDSVKRQLQAPYIGPFRVISQSSKTLQIDMDGKPIVVSIDRVKPAFVDAELLNGCNVTGYGRLSRPPSRFVAS